MNVASHLAYNKRTEIVISRALGERALGKRALGERALGKRALGKPQARKKGPAQARVKRRA
ncbi:hypothetical protein [Corynebacterium glucuronolyticum]|uniref:50S ribosomal protein L4 n=2 Tax=Corynebacterium glucuronolyticum TaxID=39791 RepID=A0AAX1L9C5_9CORY|nr:hypothetical protein [Corynebacterium glucuronolyticum]EEI63926.1 hypothetical protein HMPREF0293_0722 [Corynebacterium glucuronolyticum ATCC 51866]QRP70612.1 hypothetical protein I6J21_12925 [Corynebacterium glucuronolyticum]